MQHEHIKLIREGRGETKSCANPHTFGNFKYSKKTFII